MEYIISDTSLLDLEEALDCSIKQCIRSSKDEMLETMLGQQIALGIYQVRIFSLQWCHRILLEIELFKIWSAETNNDIKRPNSMNNYGVILDTMGFSSFFDDLVMNVIKPLASVLFLIEGGAILDSLHAFLVEYEIGKDLKLGFHRDDSQVTLNVCLGDSFTGGDIYFKGQRCNRHPDTSIISNEYFSESFEYSHQIGMGILHSGRNRHGARAILSGSRKNLIIWCRSSLVREIEFHGGYYNYKHIAPVIEDEGVARGEYFVTRQCPYCPICIRNNEDDDDINGTKWIEAYDHGRYLNQFSINKKGKN